MSHLMRRCPCQAKVPFLWLDRMASRGSKKCTSSVPSQSPHQPRLADVCSPWNTWISALRWAKSHNFCSKMRSNNIMLLNVLNIIHVFAKLSSEFSIVRTCILSCWRVWINPLFSFCFPSYQIWNGSIAHQNMNWFLFGRWTQINYHLKHFSCKKLQINLSKSFHDEGCDLLFPSHYLGWAELYQQS